MRLDDTSCYRALSARDARFDGVFFVGVTSTRIYCRPVCRARTPRSANCRFYSNAAAAERAGFRPCLRCRPELAPGNAPVDAGSELAQMAAQRIAAGALNAESIESLAANLGVSARQLRRSVGKYLGVSPIELAQTHRLLLAKRLLTETPLPITEVAYASGFESLRRFNAAFKGNYRLAPKDLRRAARVENGDAPPTGGDAEALKLRLEYRAPLDWEGMLSFLAARAAPGIEWVEGARYARTVRIGDTAGHVVVARGARGEEALVATISATLVPSLMPLLPRLRDLFDLDANPRVIAAHLRQARLVMGARALAGVRVPGTVDGFELAVRAILGQQVSVKGATTLMGRYVSAFGEPYAGGPPELSSLSPSPEGVAALETSQVAALGLPVKRAETIVRLADAVATGSISLDPGGDVGRVISGLTALPGIGDWTAHYIAMRALRWPDAFPGSDLGLRKAAGGISAAQLGRLAESWRPWRAYAAMHLWNSLSTSTTSRAIAGG